ncbi:MAG: hypothetical protein GY797_38040 [Deltaproteobacteria bacterium]|nr:hypothetical protein [Deltaproteobacteria bacterium]
MQNRFDIDARVRNYAEEFSHSLDVQVKYLSRLTSMLSKALPNLLSIFIQEEIAEFAVRTQKNFSFEGDSQFTVEKESYIIEITDDKRTERTILVTLRSLSPQRTKLVKFSFMPVDAQSLYLKFGIRIDKSLEALKERLTFMCAESLKSFSRWLDGFTRRIILSGRNQIVDILYSHVRSLFPENLAHQIYLFVLVNRKGIYTFDSLSLDNAIKSMNQGVKGLNTTSLQLINALAFRQLPIEALAAQVAIPEDKTVQLSKSKIEFTGHKKSEGMGIAELALYETDDLIIQPLILEGKLLLEAAYNPKIREQVEMTLNRERKTFKSILSENYHYSPFRIKGSALQLSKGAVETWGTFWGCFWGAYSKIP